MVFNDYQPGISEVVIRGVAATTYHEQGQTTVALDEIKQALLQGGSPATPDDLRKRFDTFMNERCKGKDATKLRFVIE